VKIIGSPLGHYVTESLRCREKPIIGRTLLQVSPHNTMEKILFAKARDLEKIGFGESG